MIYIYDVILNLNENLIEYFEWEEEDNIKYVKKLPFYKIDSNLLNSLIYDKVKIEQTFLDKIKNKALVEDYNNNYKYLTLFTDDKMLIAVSFNEEGIGVMISKLQLEEETEILLLKDRLNVTKINYEVVGVKEKDDYFLTRKEKRIKDYLLKEFNCLYENNRIDKLNYYYLEYFNEINNDKEKVYQKLTDSLIKVVDNKHLKLYEIIKLSYSLK